LLKPIKQSELIEATLIAIDGEMSGQETAVETTNEVLAATPTLRILLAEDSLVNQKLARALLEKAGHRVVVANNGREAIAACETEDFDLVLMDVQMPEMDGWEATAEIRVRERRRDGSVPIIAMTAHVLPGDRERCFDAGMNGYISKPVRAEQLYTEIFRVIHGDSPQDNSSAAPVSAGLQVVWQEALAAVQGDKQLLGELVEAAVEDTADQWQAIREAVATGDAGGVQAAAHRLKGSIRYSGETTAYRVALRIEELARDGLLEGTHPWIEELGRSLVSLRCELTECVIE